MKNIKSENTKKTAVFSTAIISSLAIQLLAQSSYPTFEDLAVEIYETRLVDSKAID